MTRLLSRRNVVRLAAGAAAGVALAPQLTTITLAQGVLTDMVVNTDRLNVRSDASLAAEVLEVIVFGDAVSADASQRRAVDGVNWIYVTVTETGTAGWVDFAELTTPGAESVEEGAADATPDAAVEATTTGSLWVTVADANLRSGAGLAFDVLTTLPIGQQLTVSGASEEADGYSWYPVTVSTIAGWVANIVVTDVQPANADFSQGALVTVNTDSLNLREEAGLAGTVVNTYSFDVAATIVSAAPVTVDDIVWHQVEITVDGNVGWFAEEFLAPSGAASAGTIVTVADGPLALRTEPGLAGEIIDRIPTGSTATLQTTEPIAADGYQWVEVELNDQTGRSGWMASEFLTFE